MSPEQLRAWAPETAMGVLILSLGLGEAVTTTVLDGRDRRAALVLVALATGALVLGSRRWPGPALAATWLLGAAQVRFDVQIMVVEVAVVVVAFSAARWGTPLTLFLSGVSIPAAAAIGVVLVSTGSYSTALAVSGNRSLFEALLDLGDAYVIGAGVLGVALLGVPWLAGLSFRFADTARLSRASQVVAESAAERAVRESEQAREIARLRDDQARLARDVHDVVGHSLAVILAQAESAQYLPDADTERLKTTMQHIATSARSSLQDVRHVLSTGEDAAAGAAPRPLDTLLEGVRASGHEVVSSEVGTPQPLPPDLEVVAYRVLQEMLTNAIKHGRRDEPVFVERHWPDGAWAGELRVEARNVVDDAAPEGAGQGLEGMRRRLEGVGGRLDVRRRGEPGGVTFTTTAWVPVRTTP